MTDADPAAAEAADSGHETDVVPESGSGSGSNLSDPSALAAGAIVGAAATAAVSSSSSDPPAEEDKAEDKQQSEEPNSDHEPPPEVALPTDAGVVAVAMAGSAVADRATKSEEKKKVKAPPPASVAPAPRAVSDFDDYKNMRPKILPPADFKSSPPPAQYVDPIDPPPANKELTQMRKKMAIKMKENEGMDF